MNRDAVVQAIDEEKNEPYLSSIRHYNPDLALAQGPEPAARETLRE